MTTIREQKEQQRLQWSANAAAWDAMHDRLEREMAPVTAWLCREAGLAPGMRVIDLACGSGHPALDVARLVRPGGSVVATDLVEEMVTVTQRRAAEAGIANLEARVADLEALDFPDASFDAATCRFGVMFCPQPERAAAEVLRVLKSGGRFVLSVWDMPERSPAQTVVNDALGRLGKPQPAPDFDAPGIYQLAPPGKLLRLLEGAGFRDVRVESLPLTLEYESLEAFWERRLGAPGPMRRIVEQLTPEETARLKGLLSEVLRPYASAGAIRIPQTPLCAVATK